MKIGTNTFGLGAAFSANMNKALASLKESGITSIEPCVLFPAGLVDKVSAFVVRAMPVTGGIFPSASAAEMIKKLRDQGFSLCSIHVMGVNWKRGTVDSVIRFCKEVGYNPYASMGELRIQVPPECDRISIEVRGKVLANAIADVDKESYIDPSISMEEWVKVAGAHLKFDPVERSERWEEVIYEVEKECDRRLKGEPRGMGFCFAYWPVKTAVLAQYGIEWHSPSAMNPRVMFD